MSILTRYILAEFGRGFLVSLAGLTLVVVVAFGLKEGMSHGLPPTIILKTTFYLLPETLGVTIPISTLLAVSSVYGRLAGGNEIVAMKASGINPLASVAPVMITTFLLSLFTVVTYDVAAVWGRPGVRGVIATSLDEIAYSVLRTQHVFVCRDFTISVRSVCGDQLIRPTITTPEKGSTPSIKFEAARASLRRNLKTGNLEIRLWDGEADYGGKYHFAFPKDMTYEIPAPDSRRPVHRDWLASSEIPSRLEDLQEKVQMTRQEMTANLSPEEMKQKDEQLKDLLFQTHRLRTEPYRRWANGFTCLFFAAVGIPVAMRFRFESFLSSFFACFLPILGVYYPVLMFQEKLTTTGILPPVFFWAGNGLLVGPGLWMLRKVYRY